MNKLKQMAQRGHKEWVWMRLREFGILNVQNMDPLHQLYIDAKEQHQGLTLFIQSQQQTIPGKTNRPGYKKELIDSKLKISDIAIKEGFKVKKGAMICPFHKDTDPSLRLNDELNVFYCFGCRAKGDIIEFYRRIKEMKNGQATSS